MDLHILGDDPSTAVSGVENVDLYQFTIQKYAFRKRLIKFSTGAYPRLSLQFLLRRNIGFFVLQIYLPCSAMTILSWISFWINLEATAARVSLGIMTVLTMTTISSQIRESFPKIPDIKAVDIYMLIWHGCVIMLIYCGIEPEKGLNCRFEFRILFASLYFSFVIIWVVQAWK